MSTEQNAEQAERAIRVRVVYKSGAVIEFDCTEFKTKRNAFGALTEVEYHNPWPKPIYFGTADVAALWRVDPALPPESRGDAS